MTPEEFLNQPTEVFAPSGYLHCAECFRYSHHPLNHCHSCGGKIVRQKSMPFMEFLRRARLHGSGPMNTLHGALKALIDKCDLTTVAGWRTPLSAEAKAIYDYAKTH